MLYKLPIDIKRSMNQIYKNGTLHKSEIVRYMHLNIADCKTEPWMKNKIT